MNFQNTLRAMAEVQERKDESKIMTNAKWTRKPCSFDDVTGTVSAEAVAASPTPFPVFWECDLLPNGFFAGFEREVPQYFIVVSNGGGDQFLVNTEGYDYPRYAAKILPPEAA